MATVRIDTEGGLQPAPSARSPVARAWEERSAGGILGSWMALTVAIFAALWFTGFARSSLEEAVEAGAARAELRIVGEVGDDLIRKAVRTQHDTLKFWTALTFLGQFLGEPLLLAVRALAVASAFGALAALMGRPIGYERAIRACALSQGFWVLGLAVRAGLMMTLRRNDVETSAALLLPPGGYPAWMWLGLQQLDVFALVGWTAMALGGIRRGQMGVIGAAVVCLVFWSLEASLRVGLVALVGSAMRLRLLPA